MKIEEYMKLKSHCLGVTPFSAETVQKIYDDTYDTTRWLDQQTVRNLCLSHERLRAELEGMDVMLRETEGELKRTQGYLETLDRKVRHGCTDVKCEVCDERAE